MIIKVIGKAAALLDLLSTSEALSFSDIWRGTGLNKTTVAHLLETLQELGYTEKTLDGRYRLGPQLLALARQRLRRAVLRELAEKHALALAGRLGVTVTVATLERGERHKLAKASGDAGPVLDDTSERRTDLYATATGRMLLACADQAAREQALEHYGLPGERWPEVPDRDALETALGEMREAGLAATRSRDGRVEAVAVPVTGPDGTVWAAIGCASSPGAAAGGDDRLEALRETAAQFAGDLRQRLGEGRPRPPAEA